MKSKQIMVAALTLAALQGACAETPSVSDTSAQIESAFNAGNAAQLANLYTDDAIVVSPSQEIVQARPEIRDFWAKKFDTGTSDFRVHEINVREEGDNAYQTAVWNATNVSNGNATKFYGEMTSMYVRQPDGSWKIKVQNWY